MTDKQIGDNDNWAFPDVHFDDDDEDPVIDESGTFSEEFHFISGDSEQVAGDEPKLSDEVMAQRTTENEIHELKSSYENKLKIVNDLIHRVQNSVAVIDTEIVNLIHDIINKVSKKIIHREIQTNSDLVTKMIDELKAIVPVQNAMIDVCLSPYDYQQLCDENQNPLITMTQYDSLAVGDIIIKSNATEIRAILHDRIDQLLEVEHG